MWYFSHAALYITHLQLSATVGKRPHVPHLLSDLFRIHFSLRMQVEHPTIFGTRVQGAKSGAVGTKKHADVWYLLAHDEHVTDSLASRAAGIIAELVYLGVSAFERQHRQ